MTDSDQPIEVSFKFADLNLSRVFRKVGSLNRSGRFWSVFMWSIWWVVIFIVAQVTFALLGGGFRDTNGLAIYGFCLGVIVAMVTVLQLGLLAQKRRFRSLQDAKSRRGEIRTVLDSAGVTMHGNGSRSFHAWASIEGVTVDQDMTLILPSLVEFYPVPHASLPVGVSPELLGSRIAQWRQAAQVAA